jgi:putative oxidoreductase
MENLFNTLKPWVFTLLRVFAGLLFAQHGVQKLFGLIGGRAMPLMSQMGLAGVIELGAGVLIALGLFTRPVALIAVAEMTYAYVTVHAPRGPWPIMNAGELALLYFSIFLFVAANGAGRFSVDGK